MFSFHRMSEEEKLQAQIRKERERMVLYASITMKGLRRSSLPVLEKIG